MAKMDDETLLALLMRQESSSADFVWGTLAHERRRAMREYFRRPYGNEEEGWSHTVTSEVQDTVEWILPDLLKMFLSNERAVEFEPTQAAEAEGAEQATDTCNYVFKKQNNGFLVLYTAFKDALTVKNGCIHWRKETKRAKSVIRLDGVSSPEILQMLMQQHGADTIERQQAVQGPLIDPESGLPVIDPATGQPVMQTLMNVRLSKVVERKTIKVEAFDPNYLRVQRNWTTPLLADCPYVARDMEVSLSDLHEMGFTDVTAEELAASQMPESTSDAGDQRHNRRGETNDTDPNNTQIASDDETLTEGWLRMEWVLVDYDGDGVAERRCIYRLKDLILSNEECDEVPIATGSPILVPHTFDGMSVAEMMSDLQKIKTDLTRAVLDNATLANNPRKTVLMDGDEPLADIDDLLDGRPGGLIRVKNQNALGGDATPFVGGQMFPLLEYIDTMGEKRTGVNKSQQGQDPNALRQDRTAAEAVMLNGAAAKRIELIGRILGEILVVPTFKGINHLLTEGDMEPIAYRLRGKFVECDPNDWRDGYEMTCNVGLGTGDEEKLVAVLGSVANLQMQLAPSPLGEMMVTPQQIYKTHAKLIQLGGIKNVDDYLTDPGNKPLPTKPPEPPPYQVTVEQMRLQAQQSSDQQKQALEAQQAQFEAQAKERDQQNQLSIQAANDARDAQREALEAQYKHELEVLRLQLQAYQIDADNRTSIINTRIAHPDTIPEGFDIDGQTGDIFEKPDPIAPVIDLLQGLVEHQQAPKTIVRDQHGNVAGVQHGNTFRPVARDQSGQIAGLQ
ncbi:portal protein [Variovorax sp. PBL-E5]|uniref:portal protein n=1 Tax=Variovorax sp. PBL-E5 TaxID=434014 RepID=UPI0013199C57|nr:hypothetical protein [Variovorax sp. PBL-E5]VTU37057.1 hypothetical protein E5CHR_04473 [Variovorax sp. PBL-E5]